MPQIEKDYQWMLDNSTGNVSIKKYRKIMLYLHYKDRKRCYFKKINHLSIGKYETVFFRGKGGYFRNKSFSLKNRLYREDGFEIYADSGACSHLMEQIIRSRGGRKLVPAGLGARDTLRLEAGMPLYGHEISKEITPVEAALSKFVKFEKKDFIGKKPCSLRQILQAEGLL